MRHPALLFAALVACQIAGSLGLQGTQESQGNAADTAALHISFSTPQQGETRRIFARDDLDVRVYVNELTPQHHRDCSRYTLLLMMNDRMAEDFSLCSCFNEPAAEVDWCEVVYFFPNMRSSPLTLSVHLLGSADEILTETTLDFYVLVRNDTVLHDAATKGHLWLTDDAASQIRWIQQLFLHERTVYSHCGKDGLLETLLDGYSRPRAPAATPALPVPPTVRD